MKAMIGILSLATLLSATTFECNAQGARYENVAIYDVGIVGPDHDTTTKRGCLQFRFVLSTGQPSAWLLLDPTQPTYNELAAAVMAAKVADRRITVQEADLKTKSAVLEKLALRQIKTRQRD